MHTPHLTRGTAVRLAAVVGCTIAIPLSVPPAGHAAEDNPNNYSCLGSIAAGSAEEGSEEQQVQYKFYCDGPITGYQLQSQIPLTGLAGQPTLTGNATGQPLSDTFSCSGEVPGYALNCVGLAKEGYETVTGQFAIGSKLCAEPRVDPLLTVTYAYIEKGVVTQAISGPFDLGRPAGCRPTANSGFTRLNPKPVKLGGKGGKHGEHGKRTGKNKQAGKSNPKKGTGKKTE